MLGIRVRHGISVTHHILVPAGLGEAADAMVELCMMKGLCLNIYLGIIIRYKILRYVLTIATSFVIYSCQL
jgi:hypothetical protein